MNFNLLLGFHAGHGIYFQRCKDGRVQIAKTVDEQENSKIVFLETVDPDTWASVVASVSQFGETWTSFNVARALHGEGRQLRDEKIEEATQK